MSANSYNHNGHFLTNASRQHSSAHDSIYTWSTSGSTAGACLILYGPGNGQSCPRPQSEYRCCLSRKIGHRFLVRDNRGLCSRLFHRHRRMGPYLNPISYISKFPNPKLKRITMGRPVRGSIACPWLSVWPSEGTVSPRAPTLQDNNSVSAAPGILCGPLTLDPVYSQLR